MNEPNFLDELLLEVEEKEKQLEPTQAYIKKRDLRRFFLCKSRSAPRFRLVGITAAC